MTERELRAVQQAFHEADEAECTLEQCWAAAISASDSRYVKGLVVALRHVDKYGLTNGAQTIVRNALQNLPEDLR